jgi:hypothetical protein
VTAFDAWGEGLTDPLRGSTLIVSLLPAGRLEGETACGTYVGGYTVDGEGIRLGVISKGAEPCGDRRADADFALSQALALATKWAPSSDGLELLDDDGRVRVALARQAGGGMAGDWAVLRYARSDGDLEGVLETRQRPSPSPPTGSRAAQAAASSRHTRRGRSHHHRAYRRGGTVLLGRGRRPNDAARSGLDVSWRRR